VLAAEGFVVLPYISPDLMVAKKLVQVGAAAVMPLGAPIGTNRGLKTKELLKILIEDKVQEQKIIELGITATDEEAREMYEEIFKDEGLTFDAFLEKNTGLEERDYLNNTKEGIKIDRLYEMNTNISDDNLEPSEKAKIREEYLNALIKDSRIGVQEEYLKLIPNEISVYKLKVRN